MTQFIETLVGIFQSSGFAKFGEPGGWLYAVMICVGCFLLYLAIVKEFEPLILLPMAFGMILANLPGSGVKDLALQRDDGHQQDEDQKHQHNAGYGNDHIIT